MTLYKNAYDVFVKVHLAYRNGSLTVPVPAGFTFTKKSISFPMKLGVPKDSKSKEHGRIRITLQTAGSPTPYALAFTTDEPFSSSTYFGKVCQDGSVIGKYGHRAIKEACKTLILNFGDTYGPELNAPTENEPVLSVSSGFTKLPTSFEYPYEMVIEVPVAEPIGEVVDKAFEDRVAFYAEVAKTAKPNEHL